MKIVNFLMAFSASFSLSALTADPAATLISDGGLCGPFSPYADDVDFTFSITLPYHGSIGQNFALYNGTHLIEELLPKSVKTSGYKKIFTYHLPLSYAFSNSGVDIHFDTYYKNEPESLLDEENLHLAPKQSLSINASNYWKEPYIISSTALTFDPKDNRDEIFDFSFHHNYFDNENYSELTLENVDFNLTTFGGFVYSDAKLVIRDKEKVFTCLPHDENGNVSIPLTASLKEGTVHFAYGCSFYYEPSLNLISLEGKEGFTPTTHFYLPKNKKEAVEKLSYSLIISSIGKNETALTMPLEYSVNKSRFGKCNNSEVCIEGGVI